MPAAYPNAQHINLATAIGHAVKYEKVQVKTSDNTLAYHTSESVWYPVYSGALGILFADLPLFTITAQQPVLRSISSTSKNKPVSVWRIPDFLVYAQYCEVDQSDTIPIVPKMAEIVMVVEIKATPSTPQKLDILKHRALVQARTQARYVFHSNRMSRATAQSTVCVMICIGINWTYQIMNIDDADIGNVTIYTDGDYEAGMESQQETSSEPDDESFAYGEISEAIVEGTSAKRAAALHSEAKTKKIFQMENSKEDSYSEIDYSAFVQGLSIDSRNQTNEDKKSKGKQHESEESQANETVDETEYYKLGTNESVKKMKQMRDILQTLSHVQSREWEICWDREASHAEIRNVLKTGLLDLDFGSK